MFLPYQARFTAGRNDCLFKPFFLASGNDTNADSLNLEKERSHAAPVCDELPVYDHEDDIPAAERKYDEAFDNPVIDMPFHKARP